MRRTSTSGSRRSKPHIGTSVSRPHTTTPLLSHRIAPPLTPLLSPSNRAEPTALSSRIVRCHEHVLVMCVTAPMRSVSRDSLHAVLFSSPSAWCFSSPTLPHPSASFRLAIPLLSLLPCNQAVVLSCIILFYKHSHKLSIPQTSLQLRELGISIDRVERSSCACAACSCCCFGVK